MSEPIRISPEYARTRVLSGEAILVCAYEDKEKFRQNHLEGAISLHELKNQTPLLSESKEIIFYCA